MAQLPLRVVLATGDAAPGTPAATVTSLGTPSVNQFGSIAFKASLSGGSPSGVFVGGSATLARAASGGQTPPGLSGVNFLAFDDPLVCDTGRLAFTASLSGAGVNFTNDRVVVAGQLGGLATQARTGDAPPGTFSEEVWYGFDTLRLGPAGHLAVFATLAGPFVDTTNNVGTWSGPATGGLSPVVRTGDLVGIIPGTLYTAIGLPSLNGAGQVAFGAIIAGSGVSTANDQLVLRGLPGGLSVQLREGSQAAGAASGVRYAAFGSPALNSSGNLAVNGNLRGTGVTAYNDAAAWSNTTGMFNQLVRSGDPAPGILNTALSIPGFPRINAWGKYVLVSALTGAFVNDTNDLALWTNVPGPVTLVAVKGAAASGTGPGVTLGSFGGVAINAQGTVLYRATLVGTGVTSANNQALLAWDKLGTRLVARTGTVMNIGGVNRTLSAINASLDTGGQDGKPGALSERGLVVFAASFTDGSSAVLSTSVSRCPADIASIGGSTPPDGQYTVDDIIAFFNAFSDNSPIADIAAIGGEVGGDGQQTVDDVIAFFNAYSDGCGL